MFCYEQLRDKLDFFHCNNIINFLYPFTVKSLVILNKSNLWLCTTFECNSFFTILKDIFLSDYFCDCVYDVMKMVFMFIKLNSYHYYNKRKVQKFHKGLFLFVCNTFWRFWWKVDNVMKNIIFALASIEPNFEINLFLT